MGHIDATELKKLLDAGQPVSLVDVRSPMEYADAHIAGSENIPLQALPAELPRVAAMQNLYVICASGSRSGMACDFLASAGVAATNVVGGVMAWHSAGLPLG